jgi:NADH:ubiquinone oxidoreductase subunit F (NADH-binding)
MRILKGLDGWPSVLLARAGTYDPDAGLAEAERAGAWSTWKRMAPAVGPATIVRMISESGLRGRGGAGFPTGDKWRICASTEADRRYAVANGYEADPGAQLDRTLMEADPHAIVEGLAFAAFAVGAQHAYIAVKASYTTAVRRLRAAIRLAEEAGYIGSDALGAGFDLHIELTELQGAFVLGEETALLHAIANKRAMPEQRPPYPATRGLFDRPTVVNNVETLAAVPWILTNGSRAYAAIGIEGDRGTTLVQLGGAVRKPGVVEVPLGTKLRQVIRGVGGSVPTGATLKAVFVGGPSGGFLPPDALDTPITTAALGAAGAIMGSGSILAVDDTSCLVDLATLMTRFMSDEACGKTIPCRIGVRRLYEIGERYTTGRTRPTDPQLTSDLCSDIRDGALCGHEMTATNPLLSVMRYFPDEFEDHVVRGICPAGVCRLLPPVTARTAGPVAVSPSAH